MNIYNTYKIATIIVLAVNLSGCAKLWPYKSDFDCGIPQGERCKSLYDVNKMADRGKFSPKNQARAARLAKEKSKKKWFWRQPCKRCKQCKQ